MAQLTIDTTDTLPTGRTKINDNFAEVYASAASAATAAAAAQSTADTASTAAAAAQSTADAKQPLNTVATIAYAATITPAVGMSGANVTANVGTLTGNVTVANPTGTPADGQTLIFRFAQDATGSRTVSFGTAYAFGTDITTAMIPSAASAKWEMGFKYHSGDAKWRAVAIARGF